MYKVVLDEVCSYMVELNEGEVGFSFAEACGEIISYAREAGYDVQRFFWECELGV